MTLFETFLSICLVLISGFLSSAEIALFSLSRFQIRNLREHFPLAHKRVRRLLGDASGLLVTILAANEFVNIAFTSLVAAAVGRHSGELAQTLGLSQDVPLWSLELIVDMLIATPVLLLFCEVGPKTIAAKVNQIIAPAISRPMLFIYYLFRPVRRAIKFFLRIFRLTNSTDQEKLGESDFMIMLEQGHQEGMVARNEVELVQNIFDFDDRTVMDARTPISKVYSLPSDLSAQEASRILRRKNYYRIPVYRGQPSQIVGILYAKDLIFTLLDPDEKDLPVEKIMRKPIMVRPDLRLNQLFRQLRKNQKHIAVISSGGSHSLGIITMTDLLGELFEDVFPEGNEAERV